MDDYQKERLIRAARTGKLTEEEYQLYYQLLEENPSLARDLEWEGFMDEHMPSAEDAELYEATARLTMPEETREVFPIGYRWAAAVVLLIIGGWLVFQFITDTTGPELASSGFLRFYSGDTRPDSQLGYAEGDGPVGRRGLKIWRNSRQQDLVNYQFCNDTLQLFFQDLEDTLLIQKSYRLVYKTDSAAFSMVSDKYPVVVLENCTDKPKTLIPARQ
ncbi:hypothetical protein DYBT9275_04450 [Dyadobacter sp. CECT 9275]|uniref:Uncharacterized protein n=1 Tax=Dyadobacter helix TaxID=2822344 RepID=A0A916JFA2_9BACT|nr:hypothetical protein [Dyadobacter sp. CECT 9275]CAG5009230.1 hypothetical protein DYBT9275_04450 [Dyadobacter sp. CECT 9275]